ncbi:MAG: type II secretion system protein [Lentisphaeraceae bacterium]|nr:type II secretion system protein [Lentisphaeraceae bacterium]
MKKMNSKNNRNFTLIELLVVIAIIGILMSLLLPSIIKAKKASETAVCISNQSQLYRGGMSYTSDNNGRIVLASIKGGTVSFDDLISQYMGRKLNTAEINMKWLDKDAAVLKCPSSIVETTGNWQKPNAPFFTSSYAMNTGWRQNNFFSGITSSDQDTNTDAGHVYPDGASAFLGKLKETSDLLYSGEIHVTRAAVGYGGDASLGGLGLGKVGKTVHPGLRSVYVLVDGHAELLLRSLAQTKINR